LRRFRSSFVRIIRCNEDAVLVRITRAEGKRLVSRKFTGKHATTLAVLVPFISAGGFALAALAGGGQELIGVELDWSDLPQANAANVGAGPNMAAMERFAFRERAGVREALVPSSLTIRVTRCGLTLGPLQTIAISKDDPGPPNDAFDALTFELPPFCDESPHVSAELNGVLLSSSEVKTLSDEPSGSNRTGGLQWSPVLAQNPNLPAMQLLSERVPLPLESWSLVYLVGAEPGVRIKGSSAIEVDAVTTACPTSRLAPVFASRMRPTYPVGSVTVETSLPAENATEKATGNVAAPAPSWEVTLPVRGHSLRVEPAEGGRYQVRTVGVGKAKTDPVFVGVARGPSLIWETRVVPNQAFAFPLLGDDIYSVHATSTPFARGDDTTLQFPLFNPAKRVCELGAWLQAEASKATANPGSHTTTNAAPNALAKTALPKTAKPTVRLTLSNRASYERVRGRAAKTGAASLFSGFLAEAILLWGLARGKRRRGDEAKPSAELEVSTGASRDRLVPLALALSLVAATAFGFAFLLWRGV
jgi:hypothetical protein